MDKLKDPRTNRKYILIVVIIVSFALVFLGWQWWLTEKETKVSGVRTFEKVNRLEEKKITPLKEKLEVPAGWKTYRSKKYDYEIKYPLEEDGWFVTGNFRESSLSYSPLEEIQLLTMRSFCDENDPSSCLLDLWDNVIIGVEVYEEPVNASVKEWLTKGLINNKDCDSSSFSVEYKRGGIHVFEYERSNCHLIYLYKEGGKYIYGLGFQLEKEEFYESYEPLKLTIPNSKVAEIFNKMISTFTLIDYTY